MTKLAKEYYLNPDVVDVAKDLLGKLLITNIHGVYTSGLIVETEAYTGIHDKASHSYGGKRTQRNDAMYAEGGISYVYLCYGLHALFNIVTHQEGVPQAVLIRAIEPVEGVEVMMQRKLAKQMGYNLGNGPGNVCKSMGISTKHNRLSLIGNTIWIDDQGIKYPDLSIIASARVGVAYAQEDALLPYRFRIKGNRWTGR
jgi:DNA-3-methyladenine glycosylase